VFLTGLEETTFPLERSATTASGLDEERRLMYVGITRARENLVISWRRQLTLIGGFTGTTTRSIDAKPSRFLRDLPQEVCDLINGGGGDFAEIAAVSAETSSSFGKSSYSEYGNKSSSSGSSSSSSYGSGGDSRFSSGPTRSFSNSGQKAPVVTSRSGFHHRQSQQQQQQSPTTSRRTTSPTKTPPIVRSVIRAASVIRSRTESTSSIPSKADVLRAHEARRAAAAAAASASSSGTTSTATADTSAGTTCPSRKVISLSDLQQQQALAAEQQVQRDIAAVKAELQAAKATAAAAAAAAAAAKEAAKQAQLKSAVKRSTAASSPTAAAAIGDVQLQQQQKQQIQRRQQQLQRQNDGVTAMPLQGSSAGATAAMSSDKLAAMRLAQRYAAGTLVRHKVHGEGVVLDISYTPVATSSTTAASGKSPTRPNRQGLKIRGDTSASSSSSSSSASSSSGSSSSAQPPQKQLSARVRFGLVTTRVPITTHKSLEVLRN
jgi:trimeric autotransporter adhesin